MEIFNELNDEFHFNLDPTSRPIGGLPGLKDGLREPWWFSKQFLKPPPAGKSHPKSRVFDNPAYGRGLIDAKVAKCIKEMKLGRVELAAFLIPLRNSGYFKLLRRHGAEFRLCEKRLKFGDADSSAGVKQDKTMTCPHCSKTILLKKAKPYENNSAPFDSIVAIIHA